MSVNSEFITETVDIVNDCRLWDVNIGAIGSLTTSEVRDILTLLEGWGYVWGDVPYMPFEYDVVSKWGRP